MKIFDTVKLLVIIRRGLKAAVMCEVNFSSAAVRRCDNYIMWSENKILSLT